MRNHQGPSISESQLTPGTEPLRRLLTLVGSQRASSFRSKKVTQFTIVVNCYVQINTGCQQAGVPRGGTNFGEGASSGQRVTNVRVPPVVDSQRPKTS